MRQNYSFLAIRISCGLFLILLWKSTNEFICVCIKSFPSRLVDKRLVFWFSKASDKAS